LIIKKLTLENIRSYKYQEIEFPGGATLLAGDIGAGKTTVLLAIEFALFGLQPGQKGASLLRNGTKEGRVVLDLEIEGRKINLERSLKKSKTVAQDSAYIDIDGEKKELSVTELKHKVLSLLDYPKEFEKKTNLLYKFTVYTPQEEMKQIILENAESRLNTLRHIFGIDKYKRIKENTSIFTLSLREEIRNKQGQISDLDSIMQKKLEKQSALQSLLQERIKFESTHNLLSESRKKIESELVELKSSIDQKRNLEQEMDKTTMLLSGKRESILNLDKEKQQLISQISEIERNPFDPNRLETLSQAKKQLEEELELHHNNYTEILTVIKSLSSKVEENDIFLKNIYNLTSCPTCLQNIQETYKANIKNKFESEISQHKNKIQESEIKKQELIHKVENIKKQTQVVHDQISEFNISKLRNEQLQEKKQRLNAIEKQGQTFLNDEKILRDQIETLRRSLGDFAKLQIQFDNKEKEFNLAREQEKNAEVKLAEITKEIQLTQQQIKELEEQVNLKQQIKERLHHIEELEQWISDKFLSNISYIERNILITLREEFSKLLNEWFNILVPDVFTIRLDEDFSPIVEQQDYELDYNFLSGGERTAIALAYRLALNQTINSLLSKIKTREIVILDEPTDGFSDQQLDKMRDVLAQLNLKQLIIVSHEQKIESFVEHIIKFKKEQGQTIVED